MSKIADEQNLNGPVDLLGRWPEVARIYSNRNMSNSRTVRVGAQVIGIVPCHGHNPVKPVAHRNFVIQHRHPSIEAPEPFNRLAGLLEGVIRV